MIADFHVRALALLLASACAPGLSGCSTERAYGAGQAWQRLECNKIDDAQARSRCMANASTSYEEYQRQVEAAKGAK